MLVIMLRAAPLLRALSTSHRSSVRQGCCFCEQCWDWSNQLSVVAWCGAHSAIARQGRQRSARGKDNKPHVTLCMHRQLQPEHRGPRCHELTTGVPVLCISLWVGGAARELPSKPPEQTDCRRDCPQLPQATSYDHT